MLSKIISRATHYGETFVRITHYGDTFLNTQNYETDAIDIDLENTH